MFLISRGNFPCRREPVLEKSLRYQFFQTDGGGVVSGVIWRFFAAPIFLEKASLSKAFVDFCHGSVEEVPQLHIFTNAPLRAAALKKPALMGVLMATRQDEIGYQIFKNATRARFFVDLLRR